MNMILKQQKANQNEYIVNLAPGDKIKQVSTLLYFKVSFPYY